MWMPRRTTLRTWGSVCSPADGGVTTNGPVSILLVSRSEPPRNIMYTADTLDKFGRGPDRPLNVLGTLLPLRTLRSLRDRTVGHGLDGYLGHVRCFRVIIDVFFRR